MNNKEFIADLAQRSNYTQTDVQKMVETVVNRISTALTDGDSVVIPQFGTFEVKKRLERLVVIPSSRQRMLVPPKLIVNFRPVASIKELLKKGGTSDE